MSESTLKKSSYNLIFGVLGQLIAIAFGIILPRLVLVEYGSEINGLINSVTQIFSYFSLLEAGVGGVALQSLYKTVGKQDNQETNAILSAVNIFYRRTSLLYFIAVIVLAIGYPIVVDTSISWWIIVAVIACNGIGPVANYLVRAKYSLLLQAEGKNYILINIETSMHVLVNIAKIALLMNGLNVVVVQFSALVFNLVQTAIVFLYIKNKYKWIDLNVTPNNDALKQSKNAMVHQLGALVFNNTDTILLTLFAGLSQVSVYAIYALLFGMVKTAIYTINESLKFILGQSFNNDIDRFKKINRIYENYYIAIVVALYTIASFFMVPFLRLYTAGIDDADYFMPWLALIFAISNILTYVRTPSLQVIGFAKHYKETQSRCIIETVINLVVSIALVIPFGIYGVLIGTIVALIYRTVDMVVYANKKILNQGFGATMLKIVVYFIIFTAIQIVNSYIVLDLTSYVKIVLWCIPYSAVVVSVFFTAAVALDIESARFIIDEIKEKILNRRRCGKNADIIDDTAGRD